MFGYCIWGNRAMYDSLKSSFINVKFFLFLFIFFIVVFREFDLFLHPRFWAEEGRVYFLAAYSEGLKAILFSHQGYFSLTPNIATYLSTLLPLQLAPIPTLIFSFIVTLIPGIFIIYSKSYYLNSFFSKFMAILIVYFVANTEEVWLNTINSQFWFVIIIFLVLMENKSSISRARSNAYFFLTLASGLSGVPANFLAPFFLFKYSTERSKADLKLFYVLLVTSFIQFFYILVLSDYSSSRFVFDGEKIISAVKTSIYGIVHHPFAFNSDVTPKFALIFSLIIIGLLITKKNLMKTTIVLIIPFFVSFLMTFTSLGMQGGGRYFFPVAVIYVLSVFYLIRENNLSLNLKILVYVFLFSAIVLGIQKYPFKPGFSTHPEWHKWGDEVVKFQNGEQDFISLYPQWKNAYWSVELPRK